MGLLSWFRKKSVEPEGGDVGVVGHEVATINVPAGSSVRVSDPRTTARLARIEQALINAENRRVNGDATMELKIDQLKAERTILEAQRILRGG